MLNVGQFMFLVAKLDAGFWAVVIAVLGTGMITGIVVAIWLLRRHPIMKLPAPAWRIGLQNAGRGLLGFIVLWAALAALIGVIRRQSFQDSLPVAFMTAWGVMALFELGSMIYRRREPGKVLLDLGPNPKRWQLLGIAIFFPIFLIGVANRQAIAFRDPLIIASFVAIVLYSVACYRVMMNTRFQLCENGMHLYGTLLPWEKLVSYHWLNDEIVSYTYKGLCMSHAGIPVPAEHRDAFDAIMEQYCPCSHPFDEETT